MATDRLNLGLAAGPGVALFGSGESVEKLGFRRALHVPVQLMEDFTLSRASVGEKQPPPSTASNRRWIHLRLS